MRYPAAMAGAIPVILLIGCGKMGAALLRGWQSGRGGENVRGGDSPADSPAAPFTIHIIEPDAEARGRVAADGVAAFPDAASVAATPAPDAIVVAVPPPVVATALNDCQRWMNREIPVISLAAGVRLEDMSAALPADSRLSLIRAMPNIPATIAAGMTVLCPAAGVGDANRALAERLLRGVGEVAWIEDETLMDAVTAVSGCGPAYVFAFIEALSRAGMEVGLAEDLSRRLAAVTAAGAARMALENIGGVQAAELCRHVATPGGATAAAMRVMSGGEGNRLETLLRESVTAACARARELGQAGETGKSGES